MKYIISSIIILSIFCLSNQEKRCSDIKNGKFRYFDSSSNEAIEIRTDSIQIDSFPNIGLTLYSKVKWTSECNYEATVYKVSDPEMELLIGKTFEYEILSINNNEVKLKAKTVNKKRETELIMYIIN